MAWEPMLPAPALTAPIATGLEPLMKGSCTCADACSRSGLNNRCPHRSHHRTGVSISVRDRCAAAREKQKDRRDRYGDHSFHWSKLGPTGSPFNRKSLSVQLKFQGCRFSNSVSELNHRLLLILFEDFDVALCLGDDPFHGQEAIGTH